MKTIENSVTYIRENWFKKHEILSKKGEGSLQEIIFGEEGTSIYQVKYVLAGNMVFISGDLGVAVYELTEAATIKNIGVYNLDYFTSKLVTSQRDVYVYEGNLAAAQIEGYFLDWREVSTVSELNPTDKQLLDELIETASIWITQELYSESVYKICERSNVEWLDDEVVSYLAKCGLQLSTSVIAYWVGLQMIAELQKEDNGYQSEQKLDSQQLLR